MPRSGLVAACDDRRLIGVDLWPVQRRLLEGVERHRLNVWACGRRSGKTTAAAAVLVWDACLRDLRDRLRPGERRFAVGVATNQRQARLLLEAARTIVTGSPLLRGLLAEESDDELRFTTGATIVAFPATARGVRGWAVSSLVFDELAHMLDADSNQAAEPLWRALLPATAQFGDASRVVAASTPYGEGGLFHELYVKAAAGELEDAHAVQATTAEANPTISPDFLRREFERDPDSYAGEYEAKFLGSGGSYIDPARLREVVADRGELDRLDAERWVLGVDLAFTSDPAAAVLLGGARRLLRVGLVRRWEPRKAASFEERRSIEDNLLADVAELARYFDAEVVVDQYMAEQVERLLNAQRLRVRRVPLSASTKSLAFGELRARIHDRTIELPNEPELLADLRGLRAQYRAGHSSVVTPRTSRGHSDLAVALALATWTLRDADSGDSYAAFRPDSRSLDDLLSAHRSRDVGVL